jgi:hypothetical protein
MSTENLIFNILQVVFSKPGDGIYIYKGFLNTVFVDVKAKCPKLVNFQHRLKEIFRYKGQLISEWLCEV